MGSRGVLNVDVDELGVDMFEGTAVGPVVGGIIPIVTYDEGTFTYSPLEFKEDDMFVVHIVFETDEDTDACWGGPGKPETKENC